MASTAMRLSLFLLLALLLSFAHARDSQFFNKIPSTTNNVVVPTATKEIPTTNQQEPNFLPENENSYGLYGHESGQDPPSAAAATTTTPAAAEFKQPVNKYLPKNYNPVAYVTQPESVNEFTEERSFSNNPDATSADSKSNYYNSEENFYNNQQHEEEEAAEFRSYPTTTTANDRDTGAGNYYGGGSSFNSQPQGGDATTTFNSRGAFQPQGMSDTRSVENGKYFYDLNSEKYNSNHPYERLRGSARAQNEFNNRNFYANNAQNEFENRNFNGNNAQNEFNSRNFNGNNAYDFNGENSVGGYQNQEEFENMP